MEQENLFHEDIYDALKSCIQALGGNKVVGARFWPEKPVDKAGEQVSDCLNRSRPQKFDPEQVLWILAESRKVNCHVGMYFIADDCDYERPNPVEPESEQAKLQREYVEAAKAMAKIAERIEHLQTLRAA